MLDRAGCQQICDTALAMTDADDAVIRVDGGRREHLRFARNQVTTSGIDHDQTVEVTVSYGAKTGTASGNQLDDAGIRAIVQAAQALAKVAPEDPEHMPSPKGQTYMVPGGFREPEDPDAMVQGVARITGSAANAGLIAAGFVENERRVRAVATRRGSFGWDSWGHSQASTTVRTPDGRGSGWAAEAALVEDQLDWAGMAERAVTKAEQSVGARALEPGTYVTLLEPSAVAELATLLKGSLDRRRTDEGRSWLSRPGGENALGETLFPIWMNARSHPGDARAPGRMFTSNGMANMPSFWIQQGAIKRLPCSRYWAEKTGTGYQMPPTNWLMSGQSGTVQDLIAGIERGVLVTSLWYIRSVDPRQLLYTGLTRDGTFWIEDGQVAHPLKNMRWNDSPLTVFGNATRAGDPVRAVARKGSGDTVVPPIVTPEFHFTSVSEAV